MTRFRRLAVGATLAGILTATGLAAAAPVSAAAGPTASAAPMVWLEYGAYGSEEECDIARALHGPPTSQCSWKFYDWANFGWYFGSNH